MSGKADDKQPYVPNSAQPYGGAGAKAAAPTGLRSALRLDRNGLRRARFRKRGWTLIVAAMPLMFAAVRSLFAGDAIGMGVNLGLFALFVFGAFMIQQGGEAEAAYLDRTYASPPSMPRKLIGSLVVGAATALPHRHLR